MGSGEISRCRNGSESEWHGGGENATQAPGVAGAKSEQTRAKKTSYGAEGEVLGRRPGPCACAGPGSTTKDCDRGRLLLSPAGGAGLHSPNPGRCTPVACWPGGVQGDPKLKIKKASEVILRRKPDRMGTGAREARDDRRGLQGAVPLSGTDGGYTRERGGERGGGGGGRQCGGEWGMGRE